MGDDVPQPSPDWDTGFRADFAKTEGTTDVCAGMLTSGGRMAPRLTERRLHWPPWPFCVWTFSRQAILVVSEWEWPQ